MSESNPAGADVGIAGLAVMGRNLALNMADRGWTVALYNRSPERTVDLAATAPAGASLVATVDLEAFTGALERPRKIVMMIKAGDPVDDLIDQLRPYLDPGDILVDGGNSRYTDTERRCGELREHGVNFVGLGVSGGEEGARYGPSLMPGGERTAWGPLEPILTSIAAEADGDRMATWLGPGGSGHFVKMVHNGIEYGDMQVIAEAHDIMRRGLGMRPDQERDHFTRWNDGKLDSYLMEITADILGHTQADGTPTLDLVLDAAGQKGTGRWAVEAALDHPTPVTLVGESVFARMVSALVDERNRAASVFGDTVTAIEDDPDEVIADLHDALYGAKIVSYAQGFMLMGSASEAYGWDLDPATIAGLWRAGCIIRSRFLEDIMEAFRRDPDLDNLLLDPYFTDELTAVLGGWRRTVVRAVEAGIPTPAYATALAFFDAYRSERLPADLIQAQRDYFGAHTYERIDRPRGEFFHTNWTGSGGDVTSGSYHA
jgi:6-phosphogluconate dehydrogenase